MLTAAVSVASFSVVLAETFAAVGLSTVVPAGVVTLARMVKQIAGDPTQSASNGTTAAKDDVLHQIAGQDASGTTPAKLGMPGADTAAKLVNAMAASLDELNLLLPSSAKIHAEFTFEARERYDVAASGNLGVAAEVAVVGISAGFSALYEAKSTNKITLDIDFAPVNIKL